MFEWLDSLIDNPEKFTVLGSGLAFLITTVFLAYKGAMKGTPSDSTVNAAAVEMTKMSCGAPELQKILLTITEQNRMLAEQNNLAMERQRDITQDIQRIRDQVTVLEDRIPRRR